MGLQNKRKRRTQVNLESRRKSHLSARGDSQFNRVKYKEKHAPSIKLTPARVFSAVLTALDMSLHQMNVISAFLDADLEELVFADQPLELSAVILP